MNNFIQDINKLNNDKSIDKKEDNYFNSLPTETFSNKEKNSDVINLSELSKIKLEYERDDVKMNNGQFNNEINNNLNQPELNQGPTFGGRFFPSLEDEPTNMMDGLSNVPSVTTPPIAPEPMGVSNQPIMNNNLIDLTDLSIDNAKNGISMPNFEPQMNNSVAGPMTNNNMDQVQNNSFEMVNTGMSSIPTNNNIINLENLQNNNSTVTQMSEPVSIDILNADFGVPQAMPNFDINSAPTVPTPPMELNIPQKESINEPMTIPSFGINQEPIMEVPQTMPNFDINTAPAVPTPSMELNILQNESVNEPMTIPSFGINQGPNMEVPQAMPNFDINTAPAVPTPPMELNILQNESIKESMIMPNFDNNISMPNIENFKTNDNNISMPNLEINSESKKDVIPVTNTIKNLVNSLKDFGYKINIIEEDLINISKLTIEIEK